MRLLPKEEKYFSLLNVSSALSLFDRRLNSTNTERFGQFQLCSRPQ